MFVHLVFYFMSFCSVVLTQPSYFIYEPPFEKMADDYYWSTWKFRESPMEDVWKTKDKMVYKNNNVYPIRGTNFNGIESNCKVPLGLFAKPLHFFIDFLTTHKFNSIRIPISYEIMNNLTTGIGDCVQAEPLFYKNMPARDMIKILLNHFHQANISVLFDMHTIGGVITPTPWTEHVNENMAISAWLNFLDAFHTHPAFMGIEIKNEPHQMQLERFLEYCAKVIFNIEKHVPDYHGLYFISGVQMNGPWGGSFDNTLSSFQGFTHPNLLCTVDTPVDKYILNPHVYGPSVRGNRVISENEDTWENAYGFITNLSNHWASSAIIPTEWGGQLIYDDADYYTRWLNWHVSTKNLTAGGYFWTLTPFSLDTGGIFDDNYNVNYPKLAFINKLTPFI